MIINKIRYIVAAISVFIGSNAIAISFNLEASADIQEVPRAACDAIGDRDLSHRCVKISYFVESMNAPYYWMYNQYIPQENKDSLVNFKSFLVTNGEGAIISLAKYKAIGVSDIDNTTCRLTSSEDNYTSTLTCNRSWNSIYQAVGYHTPSHQLIIEALLNVETNRSKRRPIVYFMGSDSFAVRPDEPVLRDIWLDITALNRIECDHRISVCSIEPETMHLDNMRVFMNNQSGSNNSTSSDRFHYYF